MRPIPYQSSSTNWFELISTLSFPVLLDGSSSARGRFDIMSAEPTHRVILYRDHCELHEGSVVTKHKAKRFFEVLRSIHCPSEHSDLPFNGGLIGFLGYDIGSVINNVPFHKDHQSEHPIAAVARYPWAIVQDHTKKLSWLVNPEKAPDLHWEPIDNQDIENVFEPSIWASLTSKTKYQHDIRRIHDYIRAGDVYQVNYTQAFRTSCVADRWQIFKKLRKEAQAPFCAFLPVSNENTIISVSPERFIGVDQRFITAQPIKGTSPRGNTAELDINYKKALIDSEKDKAENLMIVDLLRNDIGKVAAPGSVSVPHIFDLQSFTNVHHLVSTVSGILSPEFDCFDLLEATLPGGSITGAPKLRAMEIIAELESVPRGPYCGSIFYVSDDGTLDSSISIRTLYKSDDTITIWGGGGIVIDSNAEAEQQESRTKIRAFIHALNGSIVDD